MSVKLSITIEDVEDNTNTTVITECGESCYEEFSFPRSSLLEALYKALLASGYGFPEGSRLAIYNENTEEVRY